MKTSSAQRIRNERWYSKNKEKAIRKAALWAKNNPDKYKAIRKAHYQRNKEKKSAYAAERYKITGARQLALKKIWRAKNIETVRSYNADWKKRKSHMVTACTVRRQAQQLRATPKWANEFFIDEAYHLAALRTKMLGFKWHVDHIVPLRSKVVCGLHVHNNIQVIPAVMNIKKGNRHWPDMPGDNHAPK